ncbi:MotA/TolQ/ExbB proton channel family protein [Candidatus Latescibacterota bacterium]
MNSQAAGEETSSLLLYINDGGPLIMWTLVSLFIIGIAITIWRLTIIFIAMYNTKSFYKKVYEALSDKDNGIQIASDICVNTPGPAATIIHAGLSRVHKGIDHVEKAVDNAGSIEMSFLENGLVWLATIANIAPLIGFFGTVVGMILSFKSIAEAGYAEPSIVAGGISMALITTAGGLLVAIPINIAHNICVYLIDKIVVSMEENASKFIDTLVDMGYDSGISI